jgi:hypothetical protein
VSYDGVVREAGPAAAPVQVGNAAAFAASGLPHVETGREHQAQAGA